MMFRPAPAGAEVLLGLDRQHARQIMAGVATGARDLVVTMFAFNRAIGDAELARWAGANAGGRIEEFFAVVGRPSRDEAFVAFATSRGLVPICFPQWDRMVALLPYVAAVREAESKEGRPVEIRRFVRSTPVHACTLKPLVG